MINTKIIKVAKEKAATTNNNGGGYANSISINNKPEDAVGVFANGRYFYKIGKKYFLTNYYDLFAFEIENKKTNVDKLSVLNKKFKNWSGYRKWIIFS